MNKRMKMMSSTIIGIRSDIDELSVYQSQKIRRNMGHAHKVYVMGIKHGGVVFLNIVPN